MTQPTKSLENIGCVSRVNCLNMTSYSVLLQSNWIMAPLGFNGWFPSVERLWRHHIILINFLKIRSRSSIFPYCPASGSQFLPRTTSCWIARWTSSGGETKSRVGTSTTGRPPESETILRHQACTALLNCLVAQQRKKTRRRSLSK